jgi:signal transduction histidine kinase
MALSIIALFVFIFGAYAYGYLVALSLRNRTSVWSHARVPGARHNTERINFVMYVVCTVWFALHAIIEFRFLTGEPRNNDFVDLATLELVFLFPGLIFHLYLRENSCDDSLPAPARGWTFVLMALYGAGIALALFFTAAIFELVPAPRQLSPYVGMAIGSLFTVMSVSCLLLIQSRPARAGTRDQARLRSAMKALFVVMIVLFVVLNVMRQDALLIHILNVAVRATPLAFLLVSVYFENRIEFYDLIIKRGVLLLLSVLLVGMVFAMTLDWLEAIPPGMARPWLFAVVLLPVAILMPWLHDRVGRLLDRLWFGRDFTPVEAVKHVLGAMQQATDEVSLIAATEATLTDMFHRRVVILLEDQPVPDTGWVVAQLRPGAGGDAVRIALIDDPGARLMLSEDIALLRSLGAVFGYMLENVRLQRKKLEHEQVTQQLRLQTSRSELKALRAQINPHFLFNALNAIASLIHTDPARADAAVEQLAEVFRYTLRRSDQEWAPLDQELAFARAYLDVEQARFGKRLDFSIEADPLLGRAQVPAMLLQTLVENAVKHGISRLRAPGRIDVRAHRHNGRVVLEVRDTGPGLDAAARPPSTSGESFGLRSVRDRLEGYFGADASLELTRDGGTTVARIELPIIEELTPVAGANR